MFLALVECMVWEPKGISMNRPCTRPNVLMVAVSLFVCLILYAAVAQAVLPQVAVGDSHTVVLMADGTVKAWGIDILGWSNSFSPPMKVSGVGGPVSAIAAGPTAGFAIMADGTVVAWGDHRLWPPNDDGSTPPMKVSGLGGPVTALDSKVHNTVALLADGTVKTWGENDVGQLGDGTTNYGHTPVTVVGLGGPAVGIAQGSTHTVALMADGTVKAWGNNEYGQLGDGTTGTTNRSFTPVTVSGLSGVTAIGAGFDFTVALLSDGTVKAWGNNAVGQLGDGTTTDRPTPVTVVGLDGPVMAISVGNWHTVALMADGTVKTWGLILPTKSGHG
ncbi:MAG: hypothetical protein FDZ69_14145 [Deltaproteobacteria bacterium]|nr:MAG: hypothetical protein FDZ69_14145 [Deltaproteobacteria bacterium]